MILSLMRLCCEELSDPSRSCAKSVNTKLQAKCPTFLAKDYRDRIRIRITGCGPEEDVKDGDIEAASVKQ